MKSPSPNKVVWKKISAKYHAGPDNPNTKDGPGAEKLPRWNLADLYAAVDAPELAADRQALEEMCLAFSEEYEDSVMYLSGAELGEAIRQYEAIEALYGRISSYTNLLEAEDCDSFHKTGPLKKWLAEMGGKFSFFTTEVGEMRESDLLTKLVAPGLAQYAPWMARLREQHAHELPDDIGQVSSKYLVNGDAWRRMYKETLSDLKISDNGTMRSFQDLEKAATDGEFPLQDRLEARRKMGQLLKENSGRLALIYNVLIKDMAIDAPLERYTRPDQAAHLANGLNPEIVDTMFDALKASYSRLSHRFFAWRAKQHGVDIIKSAMLWEDPSGEGDAGGRLYSWDEARRVVIRAFKKFSPRFGRIAQRFFDENHIDAEPRERKDAGAFTQSTGPGGLPFIFLNFTGDFSDVVSYLGHELGHGVHEVLAAKAQGKLLSETPIAIAEIASTFAEALVSEELLQSEKDPKVRQSILTNRIAGMLETGLSQISFYDFERRVHAERKNGELDAERISDIWMETQREYYGPSVELDDYDRYFWMLVAGSHFFDSPFYVYSYSFAQISVCALFQEYKKAEQQGETALNEFKENYAALLETGITKNAYEMFMPFGLDPELPAFWESGIALIERNLNDLINPPPPPPVSKPRALDAVPKPKAIDPPPGI